MAMQQSSKDQRDLALFALEAVALDTETTGLDPRKARLIEIGGIALAPGGG
jgi:DNA polymerase-3 subunit epsilon/CBS domain-containing protein